MYGELIAIELGVGLEGDGLLGVVRHDVLVHLLLSEEVTILAIALQP